MRSAKKPSEDEKEAAKEVDKLVEGVRNIYFLFLKFISILFEKKSFIECWHC